MVTILIGVDVFLAFFLLFMLTILIGVDVFPLKQWFPWIKFLKIQSLLKGF